MERQNPTTVSGTILRCCAGNGYGKPQTIVDIQYNRDIN